jgi:hypothetical protein
VVLLKILKEFTYINTCKNVFPNYDLILPPVAMILPNLNLHYARKLPCIFKLYWPSEADDFLKMFPIEKTKLVSPILALSYTQEP